MPRQRVLGLPIGKKQRPRHQAAKTAATVAAVVAPAMAMPVARKAIPLAKKVGGATQGAGDAVHKGQEIAGKASDVMRTASDVKSSVSSHSTTVGKAAGLISAVAKSGKSKSDGNKPKLSHLIEHHTDIAVPRSVVYNQWTQFEMFPRLTKGIESASQEEPDKTQWTAKIGPSKRGWTGKIVEQIPDERIAWKSEGGASIQGVVTFHSLDEDLTRVLLQMEYKPTGAIEWVGNTLRSQRRRARRDIRMFKHFIEMRGEETGAWRERIDSGEGLEPEFAGQGKVDTKQASRNGDRRGSRRSRASEADGRSNRGNRARTNGRRRATGSRA